MQLHVLETAPDTYAIVGAEGFAPAQSVGVLPDGWSVEDEPYLIVTKSPNEYDPAVTDYAFSLDQAAKDADIAAKDVAAAASDLLEKKIARIAYGIEIKARVAIINDSKGWDAAAWSTYQSDASIQQLSALLTDGYIETARDLLTATDLTAYYTVPEKQDIIDKLTAYLASEV